MSTEQTIRAAAFRSKIMSADDAAALVPPGANVGMSGFTGSGYPKAVPQALARRIEAEHAAGRPFKIGVWTGASTAPELDYRRAAPPLLPEQFAAVSGQRRTSTELLVIR